MPLPPDAPGVGKVPYDSRNQCSPWLDNARDAVETAVGTTPESGERWVRAGGGVGGGLIPTASSGAACAAVEGSSGAERRTAGATHRGAPSRRCTADTSKVWAEDHSSTAENVG